MFSFFENFLTPTDTPEHPEPPAGLIAFFWHFARQAKWLFVALFVIEILRRADRQRGALVHGPHRHPGDAQCRPIASSPTTWPWLAGMALVVLVARPAVALLRYLITNQAHRGAVHRPDPLAGALARGAPELGLLPERFRRPHLQPRDADRAGGALDADRGSVTARLVHPGLRHHRASA